MFYFESSCHGDIAFFLSDSAGRLTFQEYNYMHYTGTQASGAAML